jgi:hypothetical protein
VSANYRETVHLTLRVGIGRRASFGPAFANRSPEKGANFYLTAVVNRGAWQYTSDDYAELARANSIGN